MTVPIGKSSLKAITEVPLSQLGNIGIFAGEDVTVSKANPGNVVYIKGDEFTDGSIRIIIMGGLSHLEERIGGVWNDTIFEVGTDTIRMGHNFALSAVGESLVITTDNSAKRFKLLDIEFDDNSSKHPRVPITGRTLTRIVFQSDDTVDTLATEHTREIIVDFVSGVAFTGYFKVGAVAPSADVRIEVTKGLTPGGASLFVRNYSVNDFAVDTEVNLSFVGGIALIKGFDGLMTVSSANAFNLKGSGTEFFFATDLQITTNEDLVTESIVLDNDLNPVLDNSLNPIYTVPIFF